MLSGGQKVAEGPSTTVSSAVWRTAGIAQLESRLTKADAALEKIGWQVAELSGQFSGQSEELLRQVRRTETAEQRALHWRLSIEARLQKQQEEIRAFAKVAEDAANGQAELSERLGAIIERLEDRLASRTNAVESDDKEVVARLDAIVHKLEAAAPEVKCKLDMSRFVSPQPSRCDTSLSQGVESPLKDAPARLEKLVADAKALTPRSPTEKKPKSSLPVPSINLPPLPSLDEMVSRQVAATLSEAGYDELRNTVREHSESLAACVRGFVDVFAQLAGDEKHCHRSLPSGVVGAAAKVRERKELARQQLREVMDAAAQARNSEGVEKCIPVMPVAPASALERMLAVVSHAEDIGMEPEDLAGARSMLLSLEAQRALRPRSPSIPAYSDEFPVLTRLDNYTPPARLLIPDEPCDEDDVSPQHFRFADHDASFESSQNGQSPPPIPGSLQPESPGQEEHVPWTQGRSDPEHDGNFGISDEQITLVTKRYSMSCDRLNGDVGDMSPSEISIDPVRKLWCDDEGEEITAIEESSKCDKLLGDEISRTKGEDTLGEEMLESERRRTLSEVEQRIVSGASSVDGDLENDEAERTDINDVAFIDIESVEGSDEEVSKPKVRVASSPPDPKASLSEELGGCEPQPEAFASKEAGNTAVTTTDVMPLESVSGSEDEDLTSNGVLKQAGSAPLNVDL
eukprot:TRINITY_DN74797_c0_g1_i1.p1 TRINITY_DN74797_c0_g1~~TRINITY_DN74797_c0_g1_i1.p1  ORF type:complete len:687 (-),score=109.76 TRINITY_DN74797_c0_g1_i1:105-2165(-)